ncbi:hypothetical protein BBJ28_00019606 [Nothophytophthora sp. Chile5]|nr:hypothetical protein BBJ28_00019606 [Nothophytophthora sp. Chile5]
MATATVNARLAPGSKLLATDVDAAVEPELEPVADAADASDVVEEAVESPIDESPTSTDPVELPEVVLVKEDVEEASTSPANELAVDVVPVEVAFSEASPSVEDVVEPSTVPAEEPEAVVVAAEVVELDEVPAREDAEVVPTPPVALVAELEVVPDAAEVAVDVEPVEVVELELPVVDPSQTIVSPLHICPVEQSANEYWQFMEQRSAVRVVSSVQVQLCPHSDILSLLPTRLQSVLQSSEGVAPEAEEHTRRVQLPCVDSSMRAVAVMTLEQPRTDEAPTSTDAGEFEEESAMEEDEEPSAPPAVTGTPSDEEAEAIIPALLDRDDVPPLVEPDTADPEVGSTDPVSDEED